MNTVYASNLSRVRETRPQSVCIRLEVFSSHVRFIDCRAFLLGPGAPRGFPSTADHVTLVQILHNNAVDRSVEPFSVSRCDGVVLLPISQQKLYYTY